FTWVLGPAAPHLGCWGGYPSPASSRTRTQSLCASWAGATNSRVPVFGYSPISRHVPSRGSYHRALTDFPDSLSIFRLTGFPVGRYAMTKLPSSARAATTRFEPLPSSEARTD